MAGNEATRLIIRPLHPDDAAGVYEMVHHPVVARMLVQIPTMEIAETHQWMQKQQAGRHRLVAVLNARVVGSANLTQPQNPRLMHSARLGLMVHPDYWGRGIGSALVTALLDLADNWLNLKRLELEVFTDNPAAVHLYEKFGFVIEGTKRFHTYGDGRWADSHFMGRIRE